jgi:uncharacterized protein (DUF2336 family)
MVHVTWHLQRLILKLLTPEQRPHVEMLPLENGLLQVKFNRHAQSVKPREFLMTLRQPERQRVYQCIYKAKIVEWKGSRMVILKMSDEEIYCEEEVRTWKSGDTDYVDSSESNPESESE